MKKIFLMTVGLSLCLTAGFVKDGLIVEDTVSKLMWQDDDMPLALAWEDAILQCENSTLEGHDDWRLPNINELRTLIDRRKASSKLADGFTPTTNDLYWSSSTSMGVKSDALRVSFAKGSVGTAYKVDECFIRCVRKGYQEVEIAPIPIA